MRLTLKTKPMPGDTFTANDVTFTVLEDAENYLSLSVDTNEVSETLTDAGSTWKN